jgi:hypothetical protein
MPTCGRARLSSPAVSALTLLAALALLPGCRDAKREHALPPPEARRLLLDRNWLDRLPQTPQDRLHVFRFVPSMGGGVFQDRTLYAGHFELFHFDQDGRTIHFKLPHTDEARRAPFFIEPLHAPDEDTPFELHLHIEDSPRGPADYYSLRGESSTDLDASLRRALSHSRSR